MKTQLDIREQPSLPLAKQVAIAADGIHHRLFRSVLTLSVVVLAVAFLANVLVESRIASACKRGVRELALQHRELGSLAGFVDAELGPRELARRWAELPANSWLPGSLTAWLGIPAGELGAFRAGCVDLLRYDAWFEGLAPGHRRILAGKFDREQTFARLGDPDERRLFEQTARSIPLRLPAGLMDFAARRAAFLDGLAAAGGRLAAAREGLVREMGGSAFADWLASADPRAVPGVLRAKRLNVEPSRLEALERRAKERAQERRLMEALRDPALSAAWRDTFGAVYDQKTALAALAGDDTRAAWFAAQPAARSASLDAAATGATARRIAAVRQIVETDEMLTAGYGAKEDLGAGMFWLLVVSFLVCIAGITNAMLISVIERFREIATMKCLGALSGFIARLFLLEAAFLGLVGGLFGVVLGAAIGIVRMAASYGHWVWQFFPWVNLVAAAGITVGCGLALATLSALYPAFSAARMLPMEAMRVE